MLTGKISELEECIISLNIERNNEIATLKSTNDIQASQLADKTKLVETLTSNYADLQTNIQEVSSTLESINKSLAEKPQESFVLLEKFIDELQNKDSEDAGKASRIEQLQEITQNISNRFTAIIRLIEAGLIGKLRAKNAELEKLQAQLAEEQAKTNASAKKLEALQAQLAEEQAKTNASAEELEALQAKTKKSAEELEALQAQLAKSYKRPSRYAFFAGLTFSLFVMLTTAVFAGLALLGRNVVEFFKQFTLDVSHKLVLAFLLTAGLALVVSSLCLKGTLSANYKLDDLSNSMGPVKNINSSAS